MLLANSSRAYILQAQYEGEIPERNGGQTLGVLQSHMEEYDLRLAPRPYLTKIVFFE